MVYQQCYIRAMNKHTLTVQNFNKYPRRNWTGYLKQRFWNSIGFGGRRYVASSEQFLNVLVVTSSNMYIRILITDKTRKDDVLNCEVCLLIE